MREEAALGHGREKDVQAKEAPAPLGASRDERRTSPPHSGARGSGLKGLVQRHQLRTELLGLNPDLPDSQTQGFSHQSSECHPWGRRGISRAGKRVEGCDRGRGVQDRERVRESTGTQARQMGRVSPALLKGLTAFDLNMPCLSSNRSLYSQQ